MDHSIHNTETLVFLPTKNSNSTNDHHSTENTHAKIDTVYKLFFDGACRGNPGRGSYGGILLKNDEPIITFNRVIEGKTTNNVAEYSGVYNGLILATKYNIKHLQVFGDSQLVIKQLSGEYKVKNIHLKKIYDKCKIIEKEFDTISYDYIPRKDNKTADQLANLALDS
jgi:ribonuclease HI